MFEKTEEIGQFWAYGPDYSKEADLTLLDNVQFIYELCLAKLELSAFGAEFETTEGLRDFVLKNKSTELQRRIKRRAAYFKTVGGEFTDYFHILQRNRMRSVNQYLTHWIYPYKGKFHPQMIRALLNIIGLEEGDTVLDPFLGSGTTALEAQLLGIRCVGLDISPLCVLQAKVKTLSVYVVDEVTRLKNTLVYRLTPSIFNQERDFYKVLTEIPDERVRDFYALARLVALSDKERRRRHFEHAFLKNLDLMIKSVRDYREMAAELNLRLGEVDLRIGDSRRIDLPDCAVDGIITSPPYSIALDYVENDAHSLAYMGYELSALRANFIGVRGKGKERIELYNADMRESFREM
ncbi:MAG: DNA methyltransferase, partial [Anaerolineales bacterium]|nr:DNA methyltransferase [Anaerolineales bacterium]MDW8445898.1 DNA methyltransferase [Anaerolineales bacterium]